MACFEELAKPERKWEYVFTLQVLTNLWLKVIESHAEPRCPDENQRGAGANLQMAGRCQRHPIRILACMAAANYQGVEQEI